MGERKQQENDSPEVDGGVECAWLHGCQIEGRRDAQKELFLSTTKCLYEELHYKYDKSINFCSFPTSHRKIIEWKYF